MSRAQETEADGREPFDPMSVRGEFPALGRMIGGRAAVFADGPGGTQAPRAVITAMGEYLQRSNANVGGVFATSRETSDLVTRARVDATAFLGAAAPEEIVFGQNMTSLTFAMSRALARTWKPGDEIVVTALDHDANVAPWQQAAEDRGAIVRTLACDPRTCSITPESLAAVLGPRTRLVALGYASNAVGTIVDLEPLITAAHRHGALVYIDAVHYAPHGPIDVRALDCDFLACSAYKFCGPHLGLMYGKKAHLESLTAYKVRPSSAAPPGKWETGTQNFEALAGLRACLGYIAGLSGPSGMAAIAVVDHAAYATAMRRIAAHERMLSRRFLELVARIPGSRLYGIADPALAEARTPTFGLTLERCAPRAAAEQLAERGIFVWDGHFYAKGLIDQLGLADQGGLIRIGFAHYNTLEEVERVAEALAILAR